MIELLLFPGIFHFSPQTSDPVTVLSWKESCLARMESLDVGFSMSAKEDFCSQGGRISAIAACARGMFEQDYSADFNTSLCAGSLNGSGTLRCFFQLEPLVGAHYATRLCRKKSLSEQAETQRCVLQLLPTIGMEPTIKQVFQRCQGKYESRKRPSWPSQ